MPRTFESVDLVTLPTTDAASTVTLITRLLTVAKEVEKETKLPPTIKKRVGVLAHVVKSLTEALAQREPAQVSPQSQREADMRVDGGWSALNRVLQGWAMLEDADGNHARAQKLLDALFPDGLKFTQAAFDKEWAEVKWRLERIKNDGLDTDLDKLGASAFLDRLKKDHDAYGVALGITKTEERPKAPDPKAIRQPFLEARSALRSYVLVAAAHGENEVEEKELVARLLAPVAEWQSASRSAAAVEVPVAPTAPVASPTS